MSTKPNRKPWIIAGVLGFLALSTCIVCAVLSLVDLDRLVPARPVPQPQVAISVANIGNVKQLYELRSGETVNALAWSPDNKLMAVAGGTGQQAPTDQKSTDYHFVELWDMRTGQKLRSFPGHRDLAQSVAFSPDGQLLASGSRDGTIKLWNVADGTELRTVGRMYSSVSHVTFSPDGQKIVAVLDRKAITTWETATGRELGTFDGYSGYNYLPDGTLLAWSQTAYYGVSTKLSEIETGRTLWTRTQAGDLAGLSHDGKIGAWRSGYVPATELILLNMSNGTELRRLGIVSPASCVAFSPDDALVAAGAGTSGEFFALPTSKLNVWDAQSGKLYELDGHDGTFQCVAFSPDGRFLAAGGKGIVQLWGVRP